MLRLKELRIEKEKTQAEMANALSISRQVYANYENEINQPSLETLGKIADFFEVSTDYLLGRSDDLGNVTVKQTGTGLTGEEERLLRCFRTLSPADRAQAAEYLTFLMEKQNKK